MTFFTTVLADCHGCGVTTDFKWQECDGCYERNIVCEHYTCLECEESLAP